MYVVVDSNNYWLFYGECSSPKEAFEGAKECSSYDCSAVVYVYEVVSETMILDGKNVGMELRVIDEVVVV